MTWLVLRTDASLRKVGEAQISKVCGVIAKPEAAANPKDGSASSPGPQEQGY